MFSVFDWLSGMFLVYAYILYIHATLTAKIQPNPASWIIWWLMDVLILLGMWAEGVPSGQMTFTVAGVTLILAILLLSKRHLVWSRADKLCLLAGGIGILFWILSGNPTTAVISGLIVVSIGVIPTILSVWENPGQEDTLSWGLFLLSGIMAIFAIKEPTIASAAPPIVLIWEPLTVFLICVFRPKFIKSE